MKRRMTRREDYLKMIYTLSLKGVVRGAELADELNVKRPTVCIYLKRLIENGDIVMDEHHCFFLTEQGRAIAEATLDKHGLLLALLLDLGVPGPIASADACAIEHSISPETYFALKQLLNERAANLSGGQCQRLALARALLHDSPVYIFDEATSNIDVESENDIMAQIHALAKTKTVILISHRLANVAGADNIYVLDRGAVVESGTHSGLLAAGGAYAALWNAQQELEHYTKGGAAE